MFCLVFVRGVLGAFGKGTCPLECEFECVGLFQKRVRYEWCFGDKNVLTGSE